MRCKVIDKRVMFEYNDWAFTEIFTRGRRIMAITSAFQADDVGSIPIARSKKNPFSKSHF